MVRACHALASLHWGLTHAGEASGASCEPLDLVPEGLGGNSADSAVSGSELQGQLAEKEPSPPQVRTGSYPSAQVILKDKSRPAEALRPQTTFSGRRNRLR